MVQALPLFSGSPEIGGHGMIFRDFAGNLQFVIHSPNTKTLERPTITPLFEENGMLKV